MGVPKNGGDPLNVLKWLDEHFEEAILIALLVLISCAELIQVVFRNLPFVDALTWPEEFCRFCWVWSVFLSLPFTIRKGGMLRVNVIVDMLPQAVRKSVNIFIDFVNSVVMGVLFWYSVETVNKIRASAEASPAIMWPMWIIYSVMLAGFGLGVVRGVQMTVIHIKHFNEKELKTPEQAMADAVEEADAEKKAGGGKA